MYEGSASSAKTVCGGQESRYSKENDSMAAEHATDESSQLEAINP